MYVGLGFMELTVFFFLRNVFWTSILEIRIVVLFPVETEIGREIKLL